MAKRMFTLAGEFAHDDESAIDLSAGKAAEESGELAYDNAALQSEIVETSKHRPFQEDLPEECGVQWSQRHLSLVARNHVAPKP